MTKEKLITQLSKKGKGKYYAVFNECRDIVLSSTPIELINYLKFQFDLTEDESACLNYTGIRYAQINFKKKYLKDGDKAASQSQGNTGREGKQWQFNDASETKTGKPKFFKQQPI
jgi:hypothetical protein